MDFWQHLKANGSVDLQGITPGMAQHFSELITRGHSVADLLAHFSDEFGHLPVDGLRAMARAHRSWVTWRLRKRHLDEARERAGLPPLPDEVFTRASRPDQLDALVRTARLCPLSEVEEEGGWAEILSAGMELWSRCIALARQEGQVKCDAADPDNIEASADYDPYIRRTDGLKDLPPHRWLAMRRGEREGVLRLDLVLPQELFLQEIERAHPLLGPPAAARTPGSLLQELVLDDLRAWLLSLLDIEAQTEAIKAACESLAGLLRSSPVQVRQLGAVYLTRPAAPVAAVVVDREGDPSYQKTIKATGAWEDKVVEGLKEQAIQHVVLPTTAVDAEMLASLEAKLVSARLQVIKVRSAALAEARVPLTRPPLRLGSSSASAVVLARRALDPLKEWSSLDPVSIGVAEYQNDLDMELLRASLLETVEICRLERRRGKRVHMGATAGRGNTAMARLNPLVKSLADLKAGMTVHGLVTNISHFGAFVNIGLPQEALVHISELSDSFVSNPNEVVSIGQQVTAHVLSVDPSRGRISLSLKTRNRLALEREDRRGRSERPPRSSPSVREQRGSAPLSKAQALANLEKLFKK